MRVIITGGSGLVGRALTDNLAGDGHDVVVLSRSPGRVSGLPDNARAVGWDAQTADGWEDVADGADAIVNLAGASLAGEGFFPSRWTPERKQRIRQSRLNVGRAVVEAVERAANKPGVVIQASAIDYYGTSEHKKFTEDDDAGDGFLPNVCVRWEESTAAVEVHGVRHAIIRSGLILSTQDGALPRVVLPYRLFVGGRFGSGRQWWSWIHLEDEARAIRFLIENSETSGPYNLTAPNPMANDDFGRTLAGVMGRPHWFPVPGFLMRALFGEVSEVVLEGQRVVPTKLQSQGFSFNYPHLESALRDIFRRNL